MEVGFVVQTIFPNSNFPPIDTAIVETHTQIKKKIKSTMCNDERGSQQEFF